MTVGEAISQFNRIRTNIIDNDILCKWISELDGKLSADIGADITPVYTLPDDENTVLLVPHPYSAVYVDYQIAQSDFMYREIEEYSNSSQVVDKDVEDFKKWYIRNNRPPDGETFSVL